MKQSSRLQRQPQRLTIESALLDLIRHAAEDWFRGHPKGCMMNTVKAYEEIVEFIAAGTSPGSVIAFRPSEAVKRRVADLLQGEKGSGLSPDEKSELDHYMQLEHLMRLAKARARRYLGNE